MVGLLESTQKKGTVTKISNNQIGIDGTNALREMVFIPAHRNQVQKIRVAAYTRVSTNSADQLNSFENQTLYYHNYIEKNEDFQLVDIYADEGISGTSVEKRGEFLRMMDDAKNGLIDRIVTKSISRFSRNVLDALNYARELKTHGVSVLFDKEGIDTDTMTSENILTLYTILAERESLSISQNCKRSNRKRMAKGEYVSTNAPYGYRLINKKLEIYPPEAEIVRRIFNEYLSGLGWMSITKNLIRDQIPKTDGTTNWEKPNVMYILSNERYVGDMLLQKSFNADAVPYRTRLNRGELPKYYVANSHPSIVKKEDFEIVQQMLAKKKQYTSPKQEYLYSKKIRCPNCGTVYRRKVINDKIYWNCRSKELRPEDCDGQVLSEKTIDKAFMNLYNKLKKHRGIIFTDMIGELERLDDALYKDSTELKVINKAVAELAEQNLAMSGLLAQGVLDSAIFTPKRDEIKQQMDKLKKRKSVLLRSRKSNQLLIQTSEVAEFLENSVEYITEMNEEIFTSLVAEIVPLDSETLGFKLHNGMMMKVRIE